MKNFLSKLIISLLLAAFLFEPSFAYAYQGTPKEVFPKLANYFTKWVLSNSDIDPLSKWDVLVLDPQTQENSADILRQIRKKNPKIIMLARVAAEEINNDMDGIVGFKGGSVRNDLLKQLNDSWFLLDKSGKKLSFWEGTTLMNLTDGSGVANGQHWNDFLPQFVNSRILSTGLWDGVFYDNVWPNISWFNGANIDVNNDGKAESPANIDKAWLAGNKELLTKSQALFGGNYLVVANGHNCPTYEPYLNGIMMENFPPPWEDSGSWSGAMKTYSNNKKFISPYIGIINGNTGNTWAQDNYRKMRFYFGSTLLNNAYFSFDYGDQNHKQTWWYDEYEILLGKAVGEPINILDKTNKTYKKGLWRRDFENGIVVVNSTSENQNYAFTNEIFNKINGNQDRSVNNGAKINLVSIMGQDAVILLGGLDGRKIPGTAVEKPETPTTPTTNVSPAVTTQSSENLIKGSAFKNGAFVRVFDSIGNQLRNGFFSYDNRYPSGSQIFSIDIDGDSVFETLVNSNGVITIYRDKVILKSFKPFDSNFKGDVSLAVADLDNDGRKEIVVGAGKGGGPMVRVFNKDGRLLTGGFFAYDRNFRGGVNVAAIDLNGDGTNEIITGAGSGGGPQVRIFNKDGKVLGGFFAYDKNTRNGVTITVGNVDGGAEREIITGTGAGVQPQVRVWNKSGKLVSQFFAYDKNVKSGITVSTSDINKDGLDEILAGSTAY